MWTWRCGIVLVAIVGLLGSGCGQGHAIGEPARSPAVTSVTVAAGVASPAATATPLPASPIPQTAEATPPPTTGPIRTAEEAAGRALALARAQPQNTVQQVIHVGPMTLGDAWAAEGYEPGPDHEDPSQVVWWVDLAGTFPIPSCPAPPPGTASAGCGTSSAAVVVLAASDGHVATGFLGSGRFSVAPTPASLPLSPPAALSTIAQAIDAGFGYLRSEGSTQGRLVSLRLLTVQQWRTEQGQTGTQSTVPLDPNAPIWELEFRDAGFTPPCSIPGGCHIDDVFFAFDAASGFSIGWWSPAPLSPSGTPSMPTSPAATPIALVDLP